MYREFRNIVNELSPNIFVIENVKGILSKKDSRRRNIIDSIITDFEEMGYNLRNREGKKYLILNAADYGVPQRRERVILIGIRKGWKTADVPLIEPTNYDPDSTDPENNGKKELLPYVTLYEAIGDLPEVRPRLTYTGLGERQLARIKLLNKRIENGKEKIPLDRKRFTEHLSRISDSGRAYFDFVRGNGYVFRPSHCPQPTDLRHKTVQTNEGRRNSRGILQEATGTGKRINQVQNGHLHRQIQKTKPKQTIHDGFRPPGKGREQIHSPRTGKNDHTPRSCTAPVFSRRLHILRTIQQKIQTDRECRTPADGIQHCQEHIQDT